MTSVTTGAGTINSGDRTLVTAAAPTVTPTGTVQIGQTGANVATAVNPFGKAATIKIDYGTTTSYGSTQTETYDPSGQTAAYNTWFELRSLTPNTVYHYKLTVTTSEGTVVTTNQQFTTAS